MAKYKPIKSSKAKQTKQEPKVSGNWRAIPCLILIVGGIVLVSLLMYSMMKSSQ